MSTKKKSGARKTPAKGIVIRLSQVRYDVNLPLVLQSKTDPSRRYEVCLGERSLVPVDAYWANGVFAPNAEVRIFGGSVYAKPPFEVDVDLNVEEGATEYEVPVTFRCLELVLDPSVVEKYRIRCYDGAMRDMIWLYGSVEKKVAYLDGKWDFPGLRLEAVPVSGEAVAYTLVNVDGYDGRRVEYGMSYLFGADGVVEKRIEEVGV